MNEGGKKLKDEVVRLQWKHRVISGQRHVHSANTSDTVAGFDVVNKSLKILPEVEAICPDAGYRGTFFNHAKDYWNREVPIRGKFKMALPLLRKDGL